MHEIFTANEDFHTQLWRAETRYSPRPFDTGDPKN